jgi:hypothetical protein
MATNISPGGMLIQTPVTTKIGEKVVIYLDALGRFAGAAVRQVSDGFSMILDISAKKRETLADQLTWFANHAGIDLPDDREHERIVPFRQRAILRSLDGREHMVKILDLSLSGVGIETNRLPALGEPVFIGSTPAVVVRHFEGGFAGEFITVFAVGEINRMTRL